MSEPHLYSIELLGFPERDPNQCAEILVRHFGITLPHARQIIGFSPAVVRSDVDYAEAWSYLKALLILGADVCIHGAGGAKVYRSRPDEHQKRLVTIVTAPTREPTAPPRRQSIVPRELELPLPLTLFDDERIGLPDDTVPERHLATVLSEGEQIDWPGELQPEAMPHAAAPPEPLPPDVLPADVLPVDVRPIEALDAPDSAPDEGAADWPEVLPIEALDAPAPVQKAGADGWPEVLPIAAIEPLDAPESSLEPVESYPPLTSPTEPPSRANEPHHAVDLAINESDATAMTLEDVVAGMGRPQTGWQTSPATGRRMRLTAAAMLLLPLAYAALVVGAAIGVLRHGLINSGWIAQGAAWSVTYVAIIVFGVSLVLLLIKPLFAGRPDPEPSVGVRRDREPVFFKFVEQIAVSVGAPMPSRVRLATQPHVSATYEDGLRGVAPNRVELVVGAPLIVGMDARQLAGALAGALSPWAEGAPTRSSRLLDSLSRWLTELAHSEDRFDLALAERRERSSGPGRAAIATLERLIGLGRAPLRALAWFGALLSGPALRREALDAVRRRVRVSGSAGYEAATFREYHLSVGTARALETLSATWSDGRLPDDLPGLALTESDRIHVPEATELRARWISREPRAGDSQPTPAQCLAEAVADRSPTIVTLQRPATDLFRDLARLCREVTLAFYRQHIGRHITSHNLVGSNEIAFERRLREAADRALERYFGGAITACDLIEAPESRAADESAIGELLRDLKRAQVTVERERVPMAAATRALEKADHRLLEINAICDVIRAGGKVEFRRYGIRDASEGDLRTAVTRCSRQRDAAHDAWWKALRPARRRLRIAARLIATPAVYLRMEGGSDWSAEAARNVLVVRDLGLCWDEIGRLNMLMASHARLTEGIARGLISAPGARASLVGIETGMHDRLTVIARRLQNVPYPFAHQDGRIMLDVYTIPTLPTPDDSAGVVAAAQRCVERAQAVNVRLAARLALMGEAVESGIRPAQIER